MLLRLASLLAVVALALAAGPAEAAQVTIVWNGTTKQVDLANVKADLSKVEYTPDGSTPSVTVPSAWSIGALLDEAHVHPGASWYAIAGTAILLGSANNTVTPFVYEDGDGLHLVNPRGAVATDLVTAADGSLAVEVQRGPLLRIDVPSLRVRVGETVRFRPLMAVGDASKLTFSWFFEDGGTLIRRTTVRHRFPRQGHYTVTLDTAGDGPAAGAQATVYVSVAAQPRPRHVGTGRAGTGTAVTRGSGGGGGRAVARRPVPRRAGSQPRVARTPPVQTTIPTSRRDLVSGTLISSADSTPLPAATGAAGARARDGGTAPDAPLHLPVDVWVAAGLAALLGLGWALESRRAPPFWQP